MKTLLVQLLSGQKSVGLANSHKVLYNGDPKTGHVWFSNGDRISNVSRISNGFDKIAAILSKPFENRTKMSSFLMVIN